MDNDDKLNEMKKEALDAQINKHRKTETSGSYLFYDIWNFIKNLFKKPK